VNENDQHARHLWLVGRRADLSARLEGDPGFFDAQIAGWWVWGIACWIGAGWCAGAGSWMADEDGKLVHLGNAGRGIQRQRVHLGDAGRGIQRQRVHLGNAGQGAEGVRAWFAALADRLRRVRVCCGEWTRVCGPTPTVKQGLTGVLLDPPYATEADRQSDLYAEDSADVSHAVRAWALSWADDPRMRIALCGYEGEHDLPGWDAVPWKAHGGYGLQGNGRGRANASREVVWFSPHCLAAMQPALPLEAAAPLFAQEADG
jgi:hypothetical protein